LEETSDLDWIVIYLFKGVASLPAYMKTFVKYVVYISEGIVRTILSVILGFYWIVRYKNPIVTWVLLQARLKDTLDSDFGVKPLIYTLHMLINSSEAL